MSMVKMIDSFAWGEVKAEDVKKAATLHQTVMVDLAGGEDMRVELEADGLNIAIHRGHATENTYGGAGISTRFTWEQLADIAKKLWQVRNAKEIAAKNGGTNAITPTSGKP